MFNNLFRGNNPQNNPQNNPKTLEQLNAALENFGYFNNIQPGNSELRMCPCPPDGICKDCSNLSQDLLSEIQKVIEQSQNLSSATSTSCSNLPSSIDIEEILNKLQIITDSSKLQDYLDNNLKGLPYPDVMGESGKIWDKERYQPEIIDFFNGVADLLRANNLPTYLIGLATAYENHYQALKEPTTTRPQSYDGISDTFTPDRDSVLKEFADLLFQYGLTAKEFARWRLTPPSFPIVHRYNLEQSDLDLIQARLMGLERKNGPPSQQQKNNKQRLTPTSAVPALNPTQLNQIEILLNRLKKEEI